MFLGASAAGEPSLPPALHDPALPLLRAATHRDPSNAKGGGDIAVVGGVALMSEQGPEGTIADVEDHKTGGITLYTVRSGETLSEIAAAFDISINTIVWANDLKSRTVRPGQELLILPISGVTHTVKRGDTLASLAKKYGGDLEEIAVFNDLDADASLAVGQKVVIPGGELPKTAAPSSSSTGASRIATVSGPQIIGYFAHPVPGGIRTQGIHGYNGVDIGARTGTGVRASAAGSVIVARASGWNGGYGSYIVIKHENGTQTLYAHLSRVDVAPGQTVSQGETIGAVGNTGRSTGSHLHFEVRGAKNPF